MKFVNTVENSQRDMRQTCSAIAPQYYISYILPSIVKVSEYQVIAETSTSHTKYTNIEYNLFMIIENKNVNKNIINSTDFLMNVMNKSSIQKL